MTTITLLYKRANNLIAIADLWYMIGGGASCETQPLVPNFV